MSYTGKHIDDTISVDSSGNVTIAGIQDLAVGTTSVTTGTVATFSSTSSILLPIGTDAQRPGSPTAGMLRYNSTQSAIEVYDGSWTPLVGTAVSVISDGDSSVNVSDSGSGTVSFTIDSATQLSFTDGTADFQDNIITTTGNITTTGQMAVGGAVNASRELTVTDSAANAYIAIESDATTGVSGVLFGDSASDSRSQIIHDNSDDSLDIRTGASTRLTISSTGAFDFQANNLTTTGSVTANSFSGDGSSVTNVTAVAVDANSVALGTDTTGNYVAAGATSGSGISGSVSSEGGTFTVTSNATSANTASTIVFRDGSGNFSAGTITAGLSGNATTASALETARNISLSGDVSGSASFDGSSNITISATIQANSVALGTDTTGNYVASLVAGSLIDLQNNTGETATPTIDVDLSELTDMTASAVGTDELVILDAGLQRRKAINEIPLGIFSTADQIALGTDTTGNYVAAGATSGSGISGSVSSEGGTFTVTSNATSANTASTIVFRDGSGNFNAGTITASAFSGDGSSLTSLTAANISAGNLGSGVLPYATVSSNSAAYKVPFLNTTGISSGNFALLHDSAATFTYNPSTDTLTVGTLDGTATTAQYADLAENYTADATYEAGTVVSFGGDQEVTIATVQGTRKVAGVISEYPAHLMNSHLEAEHVATVALQGRVPVKVKGRVRKGDMMVASATAGYAEADDNPALGSVIGKALENFDGDTGVVEVVVGRV